MHIILSYLIITLLGSLIVQFTHDPAQSDLFLDLVFWWSAIVFVFVLNCLAAFIASSIQSVRPIGVIGERE